MIGKKWFYGLLVSSSLLALGLAMGQTPGGRGGNANLPSSPIVTTMPAFKPVNGPGPMYPGLQPLQNPLGSRP